MQTDDSNMSRLVVKVGSNVLTRADGTLDVTRVSSLVDQIVRLRETGYEVVLVTSGAVACGRSVLGPEPDLDDVAQRQVYSAVGQVRLMDLYNTLFNNYRIKVGQILTVKDNFAEGVAYTNQKACVESMLSIGVLPIVNENDTVSITELMFTDNDELSGLIAKMIGAENLILLTNVDGLFNGSELVRKVLPGEDPSAFIREGKSTSGRGGMSSKCSTAMDVAAAGIRVIIACGKKDGILLSALSGEPDSAFTEFVPS